MEIGSLGDVELCSLEDDEIRSSRDLELGSSGDVEFGSEYGSITEHASTLTRAEPGQSFAKQKYKERKAGLRPARAPCSNKK